MDVSGEDWTGSGPLQNPDQEPWTRPGAGTFVRPGVMGNVDRVCRAVSWAGARARMMVVGAMVAEQMRGFLVEPPPDDEPAVPPDLLEMFVLLGYEPEQGVYVYTFA